MSRKDELLALARDALAGPDREVDAAIFVALNPAYLSAPTEIVMSHVETLPYTASLDAAMSLVPEGAFGGEIKWDTGGAHALVGFGGIPETQHAYAATPALALTAASLRALAATEQ